MKHEATAAARDRAAWRKRVSALYPPRVMAIVEL